jgi:hypothetical protein
LRGSNPARLFVPQKARFASKGRLHRTAMGAGDPNAGLGDSGLRTTAFRTDCVFLIGILVIPKKRFSENKAV